MLVFQHCWLPLEEPLLVEHGLTVSPDSRHRQDLGQGLHRGHFINGWIEDVLRLHPDLYVRLLKSSR